MAGRLEGKVAIVTGAGTGIGEAIAKRFAREGARLVLVGREGDPVAEVAREIESSGGKAIALVADMGEEDGAAVAVRTATETYGALHVLAANHGVYPELGGILETTLPAFESLYRNNILGQYLITKAAWPELTKTRGNVVFAGSEAGITGEGKIAPYAGSKGWIMAFMRSLAIEGTAVGIRVNAVAPGPIDTQMTSVSEGITTPEFSEEIESGTPMGRRGTPEEVANAYLFLASDEASYVTGLSLSVDGGSVIGKGAVGEKVPTELKAYPPSTLDLRHQFEGDPHKL